LTYGTYAPILAVVGTSPGTLKLVALCVQAGDSAVTERKMRTLKAKGYFPKTPPGWTPTARDIAHARWAALLDGGQGDRTQNFATGYVLSFIGFDVSRDVVERDLRSFYDVPMTIDDDDARDSAKKLLHDSSDRPALRPSLEQLRDIAAQEHGIRGERHEVRNALVESARAVRGERDVDWEMLTRAWTGSTDSEWQQVGQRVKKLDLTGRTAVLMFDDVEGVTDILDLARAWFGWMSRYRRQASDFAIQAQQALELATAHVNMDGYYSLTDYPDGLRETLADCLAMVKKTLPGFDSL